MPPDATTHDVALVEQAIGLRSRQVEAALERLRAADRRMEIELNAQVRRTTAAAVTADLIAQGKRALMVGAAVAMVIVAAGIAVRLAQRPEVATAQAAEPEKPAAPGIAAEPDPKVIVSNYVLFRRTGTTVAGREYVVQAGHRFADEGAATFQEAWCYTEGFVDGVNVRLELAGLAPGGQPQPVGNAASRDALGLTEAEAQELVAACPWLSGDPAAPS